MMPRKGATRRASSFLPIFRGTRNTKRWNTMLSEAVGWVRNASMWKKAAALMLLVCLVLHFSAGRHPLSPGNIGSEPSSSRASSVSSDISQFIAKDPAQAFESLRSAALHVYQPSSTALPPNVEAAHALVLDIVNEQATVPCQLDTSLPINMPGSERILFAADLHNNEHVLPHFTLQMLQIIAILGPSQVFVSIYESGSTDSTSQWLTVLKSLLDTLKVSSHIVVGGTETRQPGQDRIDFLARVRNLALEPLWTDNKDIRYDADRVVFLNDVFFCARDVIRLLQHTDDIVCGMDWDIPNLDALNPTTMLNALHRHLHKRYHLPYWLARILGTFDRVKSSYRQSKSSSALYKKTAPMYFYDIWVSHDADGHAFDKEPPYLQHLYSQARMEKGLPFPVHCCWNGLVVFSAKPFRDNGLRFRMHEADECAASECSLMCDDFKRLGYNTAVVDPGVRQAYILETAIELYNPDRVHGIKVTEWQDVQSAPPIDRTTVTPHPNLWCCFLNPGDDMVVFERDCKIVSPFAVNHTDSYLHGVVYSETLKGSSYKQIQDAIAASPHPVTKKE